jgi:hypothetical protein
MLLVKDGRWAGGLRSSLRMSTEGWLAMYRRISPVVPTRLQVAVTVCVLILTHCGRVDTRDLDSPILRTLIVGEKTIEPAEPPPHGLLSPA